MKYFVFPIKLNNVYLPEYPGAHLQTYPLLPGGVKHIPCLQSWCWHGDVCGYICCPNTMGSISQNFPPYSTGQLQLYSLIPSTHVPPFYRGKHGNMLLSKYNFFLNTFLQCA